MKPGFRVLIVDDEEIVCERLGAEMAKLGLDVETYTDSTAALERITAQHFDLVITDIKMRGPTGIEVMHFVKRELPATKVIVITGFATVETAREALKGGAVDFLPKPFKISQLRELVLSIAAASDAPASGPSTRSWAVVGGQRPARPSASSDVERNPDADCDHVPRHLQRREDAGRGTGPEARVRVRRVRGAQRRCPQLGVPVSRLKAAMVKAPATLRGFAREREMYLACITAALGERAASGNLVYHGHAAHLLLPGVTHVLRVRVMADSEDRIKAAMTRMNLTWAQAKKYVRSVDVDRARWVDFLYGIDWTDPAHYDLVVNLEHVSASNAAAAACAMAELRSSSPRPPRPSTSSISSWPPGPGSGWVSTREPPRRRARQGPPGNPERDPPAAAGPDCARHSCGAGRAGGD